MEDLRDRLKDTDPDNAKHDAGGVNDGDTTAAGRVALIDIYGKYAQKKNADGEDTRIPSNAAKYLRDFMGHIFNGPSDWEKQHSPPGDALRKHMRDIVELQETLDDSSPGSWTEGLLANSLLLASDRRLDPRAPTDPNITPILGDSAVPQEVADALNQTPHATEGAETLPSGYESLASILNESDSGISAGMGFSQDLTDTTADLVGDIQGWQDKGFEFSKYWDTTSPEMMAQMVDVATRNHEASANFLDNAANDRGQAAQRLADLYTFDWNDGNWLSDVGVGDPDGYAVAGYGDWISDYKGDDDSDPDSRQSVGEKNPAIIQSLGKTAGTYVDDLAAGDPDSERTGSTPGGDGVDVVMEDRRRLFTLIGSDDVAADDMSKMAGVYRQSELGDAAQERDGDTSERLQGRLGSAAENTERLTNLMASGRYNADAITGDNENRDKDDYYREELANAAAGRKIITDAGSLIPVIGDFASVAGDIYEEIAGPGGGPPADQPAPDKEDYNADRWSKPDAETRELFEALKRNDGDLAPGAASIYEGMHRDGEQYPDLNENKRQQLMYGLTGDVWDTDKEGQGNAPDFDKLKVDSVDGFTHGGGS